jgi:hypothetical protein
VLVAKACVDFGKQRTVFNLEGVPRPRQLVDGPTEMAELERVLLPAPGQRQRQRQKTRPAWPRRDGQDAAGSEVGTATPLPVQFGVLAGWVERGRPNRQHRELRGQDS